MSSRSVRTAAGLTAAVTALALGGCAATDPTGSGSGPAGGEPSVVATTTAWGDIARQVVQCAGSGQVTTLMPVGADPHEFTPSSQDVAAMVAADLVIANGLGLEEGLEDALTSAVKDGATVVEIAPALDPIPFGSEEDHAADEGEGHAEEEAEGEHGHDGEGEHHHDGEGEHHHDGDDPHVWLDAARVAAAAKLVGDRLADLTGEAAFASCGEQLSAELTDVDSEVRSTLAAVPADRRILVTDHDAFGYFADAYDFDVAGVVIPGGSTLAKPSSAEMAELTRTVREAGVPAIFANTANPQALVEALATEVGDVEVVELYVGSLGGPGSGAETYQDMMRTNAQRIAGALG